MKVIFVFVCLLGIAYGQGSDRALSFDDATDRVQLDNSTFLVDELTMTAWVNPDIIQNGQFGGNPIIATSRYSCSSTYRLWSTGDLFVRADGSLGYYVNKTFTCNGGSAGDRYSTSPALIPNGVWTHVAVVVQNNNLESRTVQLYINGMPQTTTQFMDFGTVGNFTMSPLDFHTTIGGRVNPGNDAITENFEGDIDEVRIWNRALTQDEVRHSMCEKLNGAEPGLVAYYRMDEGADGTCSGGEDVCDASGNGNHGTRF